MENIDLGLLEAWAMEEEPEFYKIFNIAKGRAFSDGVKFKLTILEATELFDAQNGLCSKTKLKMDMSEGSGIQPRIIPKDDTQDYTVDNCEVVCEVVGRWTEDLTPEAFDLYIESIYVHQ